MPVGNYVESRPIKPNAEDVDVSILIHHRQNIRDAYIDIDKVTNKKYLVIRQTKMTEDGSTPTAVKLFRLDENEVFILYQLIKRMVE